MRSADAAFSGFVANADDPARKFTVELIVDGEVIATQRADAFVQDLSSQDLSPLDLSPAGISPAQLAPSGLSPGIGDACYGFSFSLPSRTVRSGAIVEARIANLGTAIGLPIHCDHAPLHHDQGAGEFQWLGGLRFAGWLTEEEASAPVDVMVDGELILRAQASGWTQAGFTAETSRAARAFDVHLPDRLADGCVHRVRIVTANRKTLAGSPLAFSVLPSGIQDALAKLGASPAGRLQGAMWDRINPMSLPFSSYAAWQEEGLPDTVAATRGRCAVAMIGPGSIQDTLHSLQEQTHQDWVAAAIPPADGALGFDPEDLQAFLQGDGASCEIVALVIAGSVLKRTALQRFMAAFEAFEAAGSAYGDLDVVGTDGNPWPLALPAFDYERMLEQGYCAHLFAMRAPTAEQALRAQPPSLYRLFNAPFDRGEPQTVVHLPGSLGVLPPLDMTSMAAALATASAAHLGTRGVAGSIAPQASTVMPAVRVMREPGRGRATVIIPTRNRLHLLETCIESIGPALQHSGADLMVIDNDSGDPDTLDYLAAIAGTAATVVRVEGPFNFARLNNRAAELATTEFLCLLNNDIEASDAVWLDEMLSRAAAPDVGAVGAKLVYPSGIVQHAGVVLGPNFAALHAFNNRTEDDPGYCDLLRVARECSAVTAACMVTRRSDYLAVGGMDEVRFPVNFNDVDYCLKLRATGKRILWTPHARLVHAEGASRGAAMTPERARLFERELASLRLRWGEALVDDPFYSPVLSLDPIPFSALAWPPRKMNPRLADRPRPADAPAGF